MQPDQLGEVPDPDAAVMLGDVADPPGGHPLRAHDVTALIPEHIDGRARPAGPGRRRGTRAH